MSTISIMSSDISGQAQAIIAAQTPAQTPVQTPVQASAAQQTLVQTQVAAQTQVQASAAQQKPIKERNADLILSNPNYLKKNTNSQPIEIDKEQCSFYKKRIIALTKEMLKGKYPSSHLERLHKEYIYSLIHHFKKVDEVDILQSEYSDISFNITDPGTDTDIDVDPTTTKVAFSIPINNDMMMKKNRPVSIDDFIVKKSIHMKSEIPPPQLKVINVNTSAHKIKGVAPKQHKDKI